MTNTISAEIRCDLIQTNNNRILNKRDLWIYRISTGLLSMLMLFSATMYFVQNEMVSETFANLGFPSYIIYPLAIAKILGIIAIWSNKSKMLKEWAYAGFVFNVLLAGSAHINIGDGEFAGALMGLVLVTVSYIYSRKIETATAN